MTRTLIFTQIHAVPGMTASLSHGTMPAEKLLRVSLMLVCKLNPDADVVVIDNASTLPLDLPEGPWTVELAEAGPLPRVRGRRTVMRFEKALGHFHYNHADDPPPRDGPGRAIMTGLQIALDGNYDRCMYVEGDALTVRPAEYFFDKMTRPIASPKRTPGLPYLDWNIFFVKDMEWFRRFDFIGKYDWQRRHPGEPPGEEIYERIFGDALEVLPDITGGRGEPQQLNVWQGRTDLAKEFPVGCDYFTHGKKEDFELFLDVNGCAELKELLQ